MRSTILVVPLSFALVSGLPAQQPTLEPGQRIRVSYDCRTPPSGGAQEDCTRGTGTLVALTGDTLFLTAVGTQGWAYGHRRGELPLGAVRRVEVPLRVGSHAGTGALVGLFVGGAAGAALGALFAPLCECQHPNYIGLGLAGFAVVGLPSSLVGALVGWAIPREVWREVPRDAWRARTTPGLGAGRLGLELRF